MKQNSFISKKYKIILFQLIFTSVFLKGSAEDIANDKSLIKTVNTYLEEDQLNRAVTTIDVAFTEYSGITPTEVISALKCRL